MSTKTLFGILGITAAFAMPVYAQSYLTNGLVAYFPFNGNVNDASGNGNNGTLADGVTYGVDRFGNGNSCLLLPGTEGIGSGVDVPSLSSMPYLPVTYSAWFLLNNYAPDPGAVSMMTLVGREQCGDTTQGAVCIFTEPSIGVTNVIRYYTGDYGQITQVAPPTNQWCQVVLTIDPSGNANFYFNGTNVPGYAPSPAGQPLDFRIGSSTSGGCGEEDNERFVWNGLIDDVRVYNRNLSSKEVSELYAYEAPPCIPYAATAIATVTSGFVTAATLTDGGCGYTNVPLVVILGGGGSGATAVAMVSNGVVTNITITDAGINYTSTPTIVIGEPPSITVQPQSVTVNADAPASFSVTATGTPPLSYQWSFNSTNISGATTSSLAISNVVQTNLGTYAVVVTNAFGSTNSANATLSMYPFLATPFDGLDTYWGYTNTLSVVAWGTGPLDYQWYDNGNAINDATNETLTLTGVQLTNAGLYSVVVSSALGRVTNAPEQVVVNPAGVSVALYPGVTIQGVVGYTYIIQSTTNLSNTNAWVTMTNLTLTQPIQLWMDTNTAASLPGNYYRFYQVLPGGQ